MQALGQGNRVVLTHADAPVSGGTGCYRRPFAGLESRPFAVGAARLSRTTQRPIVVCIPYLEDDETIVLAGTRTIPPAEPHDTGSDRRVTDLVLGDIGRAIGLRPDQYLLDFLGRRRWDERNERWVS